MASVLPYGRTTPFSWDSLYVDVTEIPDSSYGYFQLVSLLVIYFALLWLGSYLIVSGSELLIFIPGMTSLVGAIILPVLGQLPMMLLSIFAGFGADAQAELEVGVGALAGGIVGQVSIYAFVSVLLGAVNFDAKTGLPDYSKKSKSTPTTTFYDYWFQTGVKMGKCTSTSTIFILVTAFPFVILGSAIVPRRTVSARGREAHNEPPSQPQGKAEAHHRALSHSGDCGVAKDFHERLATALLRAG